MAWSLSPNYALLLRLSLGGVGALKDMRAKNYTCRQCRNFCSCSGWAASAADSNVIECGAAFTHVFWC
jgi:roadblock/LC7 domain-containing protein